jgi:riboflavin kinase/FMN adenylyltransferase
MQLIRSLDGWPDTRACAATIGNFDGVHLGHQAMFEQLVFAAQGANLPTCVISFEPLPHEFFAADSAPGRLQGLRDRVASIADCGINRLLLLPFDAAFASQSAEDFIRQTLVDKLAVKHLIVGDDFRFGRQRLGDFTLLTAAAKQHGFQVSSNATVSEASERVSSSRIRSYLHSGELAAAARLLGRPYRISGRVVHGEKVGRQLGFPTANVSLKGYRPPLRGVFAVVAHNQQSGRSHAAVANLGERPTLGGHKLLLEVHVLDDEIDLYGQHLQVDFLEYLRSEQRFDSLDALKQQIGRDADAARRVLDGNPAVAATGNRIH